MSEQYKTQADLNRTGEIPVGPTVSDHRHEQLTQPSQPPPPYEARSDVEIIVSIGFEPS